jgi:pSer/pThr/pTyr-binding forkhead associated (FHA) protein
VSSGRPAPGREGPNRAGNGVPDDVDAAAETQRPLGRAVLLVGPGWECTLPVGEHLLGRDSSCRVFIDDALASRQHARIRIRPQGTTIVDQESANGVFVNNIRITEPRLLFHGDRLLVGSTEIGVFNGDDREADTFSRDETPTLTEPPGAAAAPTVVTVRAGALDVLGRVAERMLVAGEGQKARQVLADQLVKILTGARSGLPVSRELCWTASRYALKLANALGEGVWVDYTMELYLRGEHAMAPEILDDLLSALPGVQSVDRDMFTHYAKWLQRVAPKRGGHARAVAERLLSVELP